LIFPFKIHTLIYEPNKHKPQSKTLRLTALNNFFCTQVAIPKDYIFLVTIAQAPITEPSPIDTSGKIVIYA